VPAAAHDAAQSSAPLVFAPLARRAVSLVYEALLVAALLWCAALIFGVIESALAARHARGVFQIYLVLVSGSYFVWQWAHGGQTLPMKTWRVRLVTCTGERVSARAASARYLVALAGALAVGSGFLWALVDRDGQFLHDRLVGTRIVRC
jgi:uncharacterized RDD family membrane protein YckC